jgi:hypothetical protein
LFRGALRLVVVRVPTSRHSWQIGSRMGCRRTKLASPTAGLSIKCQPNRARPCSTLAWSRSSTAASGHLVHLETSCRSCGNPHLVAPLRQWTHDRAMHLGATPVVHPKLAMKDSSRNPNPPSLRRSLGEHITGRCSGTGIRGAHLMRLRPPAELRR